MNLEAALIPLEGRARARGVCAVSRPGRAGRGGAGVIIRDASGRRAAGMAQHVLKLVVTVVMIVMVVEALFVLILTATHWLHVKLILDLARSSPFSCWTPRPGAASA
jgi:hypothetical protein